MEKMLTVEGEMIHHVGYRPFLLTEALKRKKITNFEAENILEDGKQKVVINMVGEEQKILEFVKFIENNFPDYAKNCNISSEEDKCPSEVMHINDFRDILAVEQQSNMVQGGLQIDHKIDNLTKGMHKDFGKMDEKYDKVSQKMESIDSRMESIDNSIKDLTKAIRTFAEALISNGHNKK